MKMIGFVYLWINKVNGKKYVGAHCGCEDDGYVGSGTYFKKAVAKYGIGVFERTILHREYESVENIYRKEFEIINELNAVFSTEYYNLSNFDPKYTGCARGVKTRIISDETREKIRKLRLGTRATEETKKKMSKTRKGRPSPTKGMVGLTSGEKNGNWGKSCYNNGTRNKFFIQGTQGDGWILGALRKSFIGESNPFWGKKHSDETIEKLRKANAERFDGDRNPFFGRKHTEETKRKMAEYWRKRREANS